MPFKVDNWLPGAGNNRKHIILLPLKKVPGSGIMKHDFEYLFHTFPVKWLFPRAHFTFYNKSHVSTIHFSKLSARVHSQHAHVEMVFIKTSKGSPKARLQSLECWAYSHWVSVSTPTPFPMFSPEMGGERTLLSEYTSSLPHFHRYGMGPASPSVSYYYGSGAKEASVWL